MAYDRVVVGLTTIPSRVEHLDATLASIAAQTRMPDVVCVSVPQNSTRENKEYDLQAIDNALRKAFEPGVGRIVILTEDYGPLCKLMGMLESEPCRMGTLLITIDDDQYYGPNLVETLLAGATKHAGCAVCLSGHVVGRAPFPWAFRTSRMDTMKPIKALYLHPDTRVTIVSGWCGCAYPRIMFKTRDEELEQLRRVGLELHHNDDVYISSWLYRLGVPKIVIAYANGVAHGDRELKHGSKNALSPMGGTRSPTKMVQHWQNWKHLVKDMQEKGLLESPSEEASFPWYKSVVFDAATGGVAVGLIVVLAAVGGGLAIYLANKKPRSNSKSGDDNAAPNDGSLEASLDTI